MKKTLSLSNPEVGKIIGLRGSVVRQIRTQSGAAVEIEHGAGDDVNRNVHLSGEVAQVEEAERMIWCVACACGAAA